LALAWTSPELRRLIIAIVGRKVRGPSAEQKPRVAQIGRTEGQNGLKGERLPAPDRSIYWATQRCGSSSSYPSSRKSSSAPHACCAAVSAVPAVYATYALCVPPSSGALCPIVWMVNHRWLGCEPNSKDLRQAYCFCGHERQSRGRACASTAPVRACPQNGNMSVAG